MYIQFTITMEGKVSRPHKIAEIIPFSMISQNQHQLLYKFDILTNMQWTDFKVFHD